jgi:hypothetical protein
MRPLAIIGKGRDFQIAAEDTTREKWIVSSAYALLPNAHVDKIFQLHRPDVWEPWTSRVLDKLVVSHVSPGFESCERLPVGTLIVQFGPIFASSISWMLGYALLLGYVDIAICGVDMEAGGEYGLQRDYLFYLMGIAAQQANISIPTSNGISMPPITYGIEERS